jgi:pimeloyl-ACP methyl ester carboxylesterase
VLFLHSAAGHVGHWQRMLDHLRPRRRAIAIDQRGHGRTPVPADGYFSPEAMAADALAVLDALGVGRAVLVGHSMGGAAAVAMAGAAPARVAGLLLLDPASDGREVPKEQADGLLNAMRGPGYIEAVSGYWDMQLQGSRPEVRAELNRDLLATPKETVIGLLEALLHFDPVTPLLGYHGPKLSVITHLNEAPTALHNLVTGLPHEKVSGTGHWLQLDKPVEINRIIDGFLAAIP